ncbi:DUF1501 domain-containing protein [Maribacter sp. 2-571]|uniref:DUF1501 domain-containing protein n=1 Tax=Maribacter sp. 2-571 TaxID=3417569 RepID=UPI003D33E867
MCHDTMNEREWSRRGFLKGGSLAVFGITLGGIPPFIAKAATMPLRSNALSRKKTVVTIFQRGAMDGLAAVQPMENTFLKSVRPNLFLDSKNKTEQLLPLVDGYGLNPYLGALKPLFDKGQMNIVHGVGLPIENRSHFDMQDFMESGTPGVKSTSDGWINRSLKRPVSQNASPFRAVALSPSRPRIFYGNTPTLAVERLQDLRFDQQLVTDEALNGIGEQYKKEQNERFRNAGKNGLEAIKLLRSIDLETPKQTSYPNSTLGSGLQQIAQLIKAQVGLEVAFAESTGWDTHSRQPTKNGAFARNAQDLASAMAAFWEDISTYQDDVVVMTMTEFGRTTRQNGALGTDHGSGSCQFILGNNLDQHYLHHNLKEINEGTCERELPVTTDVRSVFSTVLSEHLNISASGTFPDFVPQQLSLFKP